MSDFWLLPTWMTESNFQLSVELWWFAFSAGPLRPYLNIPSCKRSPQTLPFLESHILVDFTWLSIPITTLSPKRWNFLSLLFSDSYFSMMKVEKRGKSYLPAMFLWYTKCGGIFNENRKTILQYAQLISL